MGIITLDESQLIFENIDLLKKFLLEKFSFNDDEVDLLLSYFEGKIEYATLKNTMLIDIIYDGYVKLGCVENKSEVEIKLYNKLLGILNYHIMNINFKDKNSRFIKELKYALMHYDEPNLGIKNKKN